PCIRAGTSERGACPTCGAPWARVGERERWTTREPRRTTAGGYVPQIGGQSHQRHNMNGQTSGTDVHTLGWGPTRACAHMVCPRCSVVEYSYGTMGHDEMDLPLLRESVRGPEMARTEEVL